MRNVKKTANKQKKGRDVSSVDANTSASNGAGAKRKDSEWGSCRDGAKKARGSQKAAEPVPEGGDEEVWDDEYGTLWWRCNGEWHHCEPDEWWGAAEAGDGAQTARKRKPRAKKEAENEAEPSEAKPKPPGKGGRSKGPGDAKAKNKPGPKACGQGGRKGKAETKANSSQGKDEIEATLAWVHQLDLEEPDLEKRKSQIKSSYPALPPNCRLNVYWTRSSCGITMRYIDEDETRKCQDVAYFFFEKSPRGMAVAIGSALGMAT